MIINIIIVITKRRKPILDQLILFNSRTQNMQVQMRSHSLSVCVCVDWVGNNISKYIGMLAYYSRLSKMSHMSVKRVRMCEARRANIDANFECCWVRMARILRQFCALLVCVCVYIVFDNNVSVSFVSLTAYTITILSAHSATHRKFVN